MARDKRKQSKKAESQDKSIRVGKLILEIVILLAIVACFALPRVWPELEKLGQTITEEAEKRDPNKELLFKAMEYDYSKGRSAEMEKLVDTGIQQTRLSDLHLYYNYVARGYYYCHVGHYYVGEESYRIASNLAPENILAEEALSARSACRTEKK
jgi:hypothetical protein